MQVNGREQRRRRWGAPRAMLLTGAPLAATNTQRNSARPASGVTDNWMARTRLGGRRVRNGPRRALRRAGGEATVWALDFALSVQICKSHGSSAQTVASAAARFAGRGPFLALRRCEGERRSCDDLDLLHGSWSHVSRLLPHDCAQLVQSA
jgi:hypothetical protein